MKAIVDIISCPQSRYPIAAGEQTTKFGEQRDLTIPNLVLLSRRFFGLGPSLNPALLGEGVLPPSRATHPIELDKSICLCGFEVVVVVPAPDNDS